MGISIVLHGLWDMYIPWLDDVILPFVASPKYPLLIIAIWIVLSVLLHRGIAQINELANTQIRR